MNSIMKICNNESVILTLPNNPEFISMARMCASYMANKAGLNIDEIEDLKVALSEACTNALRYGCTTVNHYQVEMDIQENDLVISVIDQGDGYDFSQVRQPALDGTQSGGFGLFLIRTLMDDLQIDSQNGKGTTLKLKKSLRSMDGKQSTIKGTSQRAI